MLSIGTTEYCSTYLDEKKTMKFFLRRSFILGIILFLFISEIHGTHERRRRAARGNDQTPLNWQTILDDVSKLPVIGGSLHETLVSFAKTVSKLNELTNGALSKIAGGYPPCVIDYDGLKCDGGAKNGGIVGITTEIINGTMLPGIAKTMIINFLDAGLFPIFDVVFGIPGSKKKT